MALSALEVRQVVRVFMQWRALLAELQGLDRADAFLAPALERLREILASQREETRATLAALEEAERDLRPLANRLAQD